MIMSNYPTAAILSWQTGIKMSSDLAGEILVIKEDQDVRLLHEFERIFDKTLIVSNIFNASVHLMGSIDGVGTIRRDVDRYVVYFEDFFRDSFEDMRRECCREGLPANMISKFIKSAPRRAKRR
jgi:hypothetical protein